MHESLREWRETNIKLEARDLALKVAHDVNAGEEKPPFEFVDEYAGNWCVSDDDFALFHQTYNEHLETLFGG